MKRVYLPDLTSVGGKKSYGWSHGIKRVFQSCAVNSIGAVSHKGISAIFVVMTPQDVNLLGSVCINRPQLLIVANHIITAEGTIRGRIFVVQSIAGRIYLDGVRPIA